MRRRPEYAIAGSYREFLDWRRADPGKRDAVMYIFSEEQARELASWAPKGVLHRIGNWRASPARSVAEQLEA